MSLPTKSFNKESEESNEKPLPLFKGLHILAKMQSEMSKLEHKLEFPLLHKTEADVENARQVIMKTQNKLTTIGDSLTSLIQLDEKFINEQEIHLNTMISRNNKCMERFRAIEEKMKDFGYVPPTEEDLMQYRGMKRSVSRDIQQQIEKEKSKSPREVQAEQQPPLQLQDLQLRHKNKIPKLEPHQIRMLELNKATDSCTLNTPSVNPIPRASSLKLSISDISHSFEFNSMTSSIPTPSALKRKSLSMGNLYGSMLGDSKLFSNENLKTPVTERLPTKGRKYSPYPVKMTLAGPIPGSQSHFPEPVTDSPQYLREFRFGTPSQFDVTKLSESNSKMRDLADDHQYQHLDQTEFISHVISQEQTHEPAKLFEENIFSTPQTSTQKKQQTPLPKILNQQALWLMPRTDLITQEEYMDLPGFLKMSLTLEQLNTTLSQARLLVSNRNMNIDATNICQQLTANDLVQLVGSEATFSAIKLSFLKLKRIKEISAATTSPVDDITYIIN